MKEETRQCKNCKKDFTIESDDFNFYEKVKVPPPTWCPECRQLRRYAWRNERNLYRRDCDLCGKSTVTIYSPNKPHKMYCQPCWWGDGWDPASFGRDFDFNRPFFEQFSELQLEVPRMALLSKNSVNSEYTNHSGDNKNVYLSFACWGAENILYSTWVMKSRDCMDCSFVYEKGERLYECLDTRTSYECQFGTFLKDCSSCFYCYDCRGCNHCFMSSNLRNKSYVFKNEQYTREEYLEKIKEYELSSAIIREGLLKEFQELVQHNSVHRYIISERNVNSVGSLIFDCKNVKESFEVNNAEDCKYIYGALDIKDSMDVYHAGWPTTALNYECHGCTRIYDCKFCHLCYDNNSVSYSDSCQNSQNLFGCVSIKKGEFMIFNKKYLKADYLVLKEKIIEYMKKTAEYGEFFPPEMAPIYFNETQGNLYAPMSKEEVLAKGWHWEENIPGTFGKETVKISALPDKIEDVSDAYLNEIFACSACSKNYNLTLNEFLFYKKEKIPFPRKCPNCRYKRRFDLRPLRKLWHRSCMCDSKDHGHGEVCSNEFKTPYAPNRIEKIYCESCYNKEVY
ncbi:MAG: hypothetical protein WAV15_03790 [Minisyncoccia bacterium]